MAFSLKLKKVPKQEIDKKVREAAEILGITEYLDRKPKALSGGQRQRVAIGRAIVRNPQVLLMDEPLSNLDAKLRNQMRAEIIKLRSRINTTIRLRHPRPDGGHDARRPHRHHARRLHPADRHPAGGLQPSDEPVRRWLHRHAADELLPGRQADCEGTASTSSSCSASPSSCRKTSRPPCAPASSRKAPSPSVSVPCTSPCIRRASPQRSTSPR